MGITIKLLWINLPREVCSHWINACEPSLRTGVISRAEVIEAGFNVPFFGG